MMIGETMFISGFAMLIGAPIVGFLTNRCDTLTGSKLDNILTGNAGIDTLTGGAGADTFRFVSPADGGGATGDIITDFISGTDHIGILRSGFSIQSGVDVGAGGALDFAAHYF